MKIQHTIINKLLILNNIVFGIIVMMYIFSDDGSYFGMWGVVIPQIIFFTMLNILFVYYIVQFINLAGARGDGFWDVLVVFLTGMTNILLFASVYYFFGVDNAGTVVKEDAITSIYFSIVTWTTLGYGDLSPTSDLRLVASIEALMGYLYMALIVGIFLHLIQLKVRKSG